jgi:hypothetical protein
MVSIEGYLQKAADGGVFYALSQQEADEITSFLHPTTQKKT